jgi:hypothetical protein
MITNKLQVIERDGSIAIHQHILNGASVKEHVEGHFTYKYRTNREVGKYHHKKFSRSSYYFQAGCLPRPHKQPLSLMFKTQRLFHKKISLQKYVLHDV